MTARALSTSNIVVAGMCGAGKTTLAAAVAHACGLRHIQLDALRHGPHWSVRESFASDVNALTSRPGWVVDSTAYAEVDSLIWDRADTVVWLDLPRAVVFARVLRRTARRVAGRQVLWAGNRETLGSLLSLRHPLVKVVLDFSARRAATAARLAGFDRPTVRLRSGAEARRWLDQLRREEGNLAW